NLTTTKLAVTTFDSFAYGLGEFFGETQTPARPLKARTTFDLLQASGVGAGQTAPDTVLTIRKTIHERTARAMLALVAPLIGFGALIAGGFSRFGLWRQIFLAFTLLVVVKSVDSAGISAARRALENWPLLYASILTGLGVTGLLLTYAADPKKWRTMLHRKSEAPQ
ncbi:MAG: LPS export ABC transporter permease LptF, partial [Pacificibacter sp.]